MAVAAVLAGAVPCLPALAEDAGVRVTVVDELGPRQIEETIAVFSQGRLLGTLHVDSGRSMDSFEATLPDATLDYVVCGRLVQRDDAGGVVRIRIDNAGRVKVRPGDKLRAFDRDNVLFSLEALGETSEVASGPVCDPAIS